MPNLHKTLFHTCTALSIALKHSTRPSLSSLSFFYPFSSLSASLSVVRSCDTPLYPFSSRWSRSVLISSLLPSRSFSSLSSLSFSSLPCVFTMPAELSALDAEQEHLMAEECILVDLDDRPIGHASKRVCHQVEQIRAGMLHRAFSVFLFDPVTKKLLLQQRAASKITFPLRWTNTCCSHPLFDFQQENDENNALGVKRAAVRKLGHELGFVGEDVTLDSLHWLTRIHYGAASDPQWGEHEIDWILFAVSDLAATRATSKDAASIPFNSNECEAVRWVDANELRAMIADSKDGKLMLTPWFELIAEQLLFPWWSKLDDVIANDGLGAEQRTVIHRLQESATAV